MALADLLNSVLQNESLVRLISQQLGIDEATARKAIELGVPLLIAALASNAQTPQGAQALDRALARDHDGSILANLPAAIEGYQAGEGDKILGHLLGERKGQVEQALSQQTGIDASALLQILAPLVMGVLGQQKAQRDLDAGGVAGELQQSQQQMAQSDSPLVQLAIQLLDANRDGSVIDDLLGLIGRYFSGGASGAAASDQR